MNRVSARLLLAVAISAAAALAQPGASPAPNFTGTWVRDDRASEDLEEKAKEAVAAAAPRGGWGVSLPGGWGRGGGGVSRGGGGGGAGGGRSPGGGGSSPGGGGRARDPSGENDRLLHLARGVEVWRIEHGDPELQVRDANRETRVLFADGRVVGDGLGGRTVASWRGATFVVETRGTLGSRTESWTLDPDGMRLTVTTGIELGRGDGITFRTVYDRVAAAGGGEPGGATATAGADAPAASGRAEGELAAPADRAPVPAHRDGGEPAPVASRAAAEADGSDPVPADRTDAADAGASPAPSSGGPIDAPPSPRAAARPAGRPADPDSIRYVHGSTLRLLPLPRPEGGLLTGKVLVETLTIDPEVVAVEFYLDGERVARRAWAPFETKLALADPAREQVVRAVALGVNGRPLGEDVMVVNRHDPPFWVRIASITRAGGGGLEVRAELSTPRLAVLDRVAFYLGERRIAALTQPPFTVLIAPDQVQPQSFIRVVAALRDGRELEEVALLEEGALSERIDVHLVELQVLVTDRTGSAVAGLGAEDFEIVDGGKPRRPERLYPSDRVALLMGLSIDSSGSMWPLWEQTRAAARTFLDGTLGQRDRAFLVDFDSRLRLLEPATGDRDALSWALERLEPHGGTALYDSILFSLLQYEGERGRRALIVLTDGVDSESRADPRRAIDFGRRLGVPVYVIALSGAGGGPLPPGLQRSSASTAQLAEVAEARNQLRLITDPTGGRLFHVVTPEQVSRAFDEIQAELRRQYVLAYYTDRPPGDEARPVVKVLRPGFEVRSAAPLDLGE